MNDIEGAGGVGQHLTEERGDEVPNSYMLTLLEGQHLLVYKHV